MKKLLLLMLLPVIGFTQGIKFENATFYQLLDKAKTENKIIFIDTYTGWCGPCKYINSTTYSDTKVASFFNSNFINTRFDMEKGEGLILSKDYKINEYPTLLFIDGSGKLIYKSPATFESEKIIELGKKVLNTNK